MSKKLSYLIFAILSMLSVYIMLSCVLSLLKYDSDFSLDFFIFKINNPIIFSSLFVLNILFGFIAFSLIENNKVENSKAFKNEDEILAENEEKITTEIKNKYADKIKDLILKIENTLSKEIKGSKIEKSLWSVCKELEISVAMAYSNNQDKNGFELSATYAFVGDQSNINFIEPGVGVNGQAIQNKEPIFIKDLPNGFIKIVSGLGEVSPDYLLIIPILHQNEVSYLIELAGLGNLNTDEVKSVVEIVNSIFSKL